MAGGRLISCDTRGLSKQITSARKAGSPSAASGLVESIYFLLQKVKMPSAEHEISSFWIPPNEDAAALPEKPQISKAMQKKAKATPLGSMRREHFRFSSAF